jgi:hypothetical protein
MLNRVTSLFACSFVPCFQAVIPLSLAADAPLHIREYSQGPQGDPFAQPPPPDYFPPVTEAVLTTKPQKKKRRVRREPNCGFCGGNDRKNKIGEPEEMVSCDECGRSGWFSRRLYSRNLADMLQVIQLAWILALLPTLCVTTRGNASNVRPARFVRKKATMYACDPLRICHSLTFSIKGSYSLL